MPFERIRLASYRNLEDRELELGAERIFLVGDNGQGKTNFLEALYYLSYGSSFRGAVDGEVPAHGSKAFSVSALVRADFSSTLPPEEIRIDCEKGKKEIRRSGKKVPDRKELIELNPSVVFCHEDFSFAAGEPERRRFFFDQTAGIVSPGYIDALRLYKRILRQRNAALKEKRISLLDLLDEQMAVHGLALSAERARLESSLKEGFSQLYEKVSLLGQAVELAYRPSWPGELDLEGVRARLEERRGDDLSFGSSLSGPHRDRWVFRGGGRDFAATASTGQLRLLSLVLRSLQAAYYTESTGRKPVLLFDDVLLELDPDRRRRFFETIPQASQAFFTFLPGERWEDYRSDSVLVYRVEHGRFAD
jgi:DNA replication and repair protein RecF